jgi:hypothetical protein
MRPVLGFALAAVAALNFGCLTTPRPQPLVRSTPTENAHEPANNAAKASGSTSQTVADTSSTTTLSSRFSKLFSRADGSDRMPLPRKDQPDDSGDSARRDIGRDF